MRTRLFLILIMVAAVTRSARSQGYFVIDQQSAGEDSPTEFGSPLQPPSFPVAQSFTPVFSSIDFVRLKLMTARGGLGLPAYVDVRLWSGWPSGRQLAISELEEIPYGFLGYAVFRFQTQVALTPGATYFIEAVCQGEQGAFWLADLRLGYPGGMAWSGATARPSVDFWFQEGIVVPEPTTAALLLVGLMALGAAKWLRRETRNVPHS